MSGYYSEPTIPLDFDRLLALAAAHQVPVCRWDGERHVIHEPPPIVEEPPAPLAEPGRGPARPRRRRSSREVPG